MVVAIFVLVIFSYAGFYIFHEDYQKNIAAIEKRDKSISSRVDKLDIEASDFKNTSTQLGANIQDCSNRLTNLNDRVSSLDESVSFINSDLDSLKQKVENLKSLIADKLGLPNPRLIAYWPFDEGQGLTVMEKNGTGYTGTIEGAIDFSGLWNDGIKGKALYFDGKTYVRVKNSLDGRLNLGLRDFTLSCWVKTTALTDGSDWDRQDIVALGDPYNSGIAISVFHNRPAGFVGNTGRTGYSENSRIINDGQWHEIVLERRAGMVYLYADGVLQHQYNFGGDVTVTSDLFIGKHGIKDQSYFKGAIDEVKLFNYALSGAEIADDYNSIVLRAGLNRPLVKPAVEDVANAYYQVNLTENPIAEFHPIAVQGNPHFISMSMSVPMQMKSPMIYPKGVNNVGTQKTALISNEGYAQAALKTISTAAESYDAANNHYPTSIVELTDSQPPYLNHDYTIGIIHGYKFSCNMDPNGYSCEALPQGDYVGKAHGYTVTTGSKLAESKN